LVRASHAEPTAGVSAMSVAQALASGRSGWGVVAAGSAVLAGQLTVGWHNDWVDAERDARVGRTDKPVVRGDVDRATLAKALTVSGIATIALSPLSGWQAGLAHIAAVASALAYNSRLKAAIVSFLPYCVSFSLLVAFIALGRHPSQWPAWWALAGAALMGAGAHFANVVPDISDDEETGVRGLPQRLGAKASTVVAMALLATSTVVIVAGRNGYQVVGVAAAALGVAGACTLSVLAVRKANTGATPGTAELRDRTGRGWFRLSMLVAAVNVIVLVVEGGSL
jgi:4-hydroxybenzoate polyprenyltransferase